MDLERIFEYGALDNIYVVDGDSVRCDIDLGFDIWKRNVDIRVAGLDAPETRHRNQEHKLAGYKVKSAVEAWFELADARSAALRLHSEGIEDLYGRVIGDFWYDFGGVEERLTTFLSKTYALTQPLLKSGKRQQWAEEDLVKVAEVAQEANRATRHQIRILGHPA